MAVFSVLRAFRTQHIALALAAALPVSSVYAATTLSLSLPSQSLASSLNQLARQANVQLIAAPVNLAGKTAPAVSGTMTLESALGQLLSGSGLSWKLNGDTVSVVPAAAGEETLTVTGGLNASSTVAQQTTSGTKTDTPLLEVPQSVSVITRQQLDRQNVQSVTEALRYVPGVKTETYGVDPKGYDWI